MHREDSRPLVGAHARTECAAGVLFAWLPALAGITGCASLDKKEGLHKCSPSSCFEEMIAEPVRELNRIFEFLGVEPPNDLDPSKYHTNESAKRRSNKLHKFAFRFSQWLIEHGFSKVLEWLRAAGAHKLLNRVNAAPVQREKMQDTTRTRLESEFRDDIVRLEELFDVDLGRWK